MIAYLFVRRVAPTSIIYMIHLNAHLDFNEDLFGSIGYSDERMVDFQFARNGINPGYERLGEFSRL